MGARASIAQRKCKIRATLFVLSRDSRKENNPKMAHGTIGDENQTYFTEWNAQNTAEVLRILILKIWSCISSSSTLRSRVANDSMIAIPLVSMK